MARAGSIAGKGQGWHKDSLRHSRARKTGTAGGIYKYQLVDRKTGAILKEQQEPFTNSKINLFKGMGYKPKVLTRDTKNMTFKQLQKKGVFLKYQGDADGDGVKNIKDCRPLNPKAQDNGIEITTYEPKTLLPEKTTSTPEEKPKGFFEKLKEKNEQRKKEREEQQEKQREKEHEQRQKEIKKLQQEIDDLNEIKEKQRLASKEKETLSEVQKERNRLKHEKAIKRLNALKAGLATAGSFIKKEYKSYKKSSKKGRGKSKKTKKGDRIFPTLKEIYG